MAIESLAQQTSAFVDSLSIKPAPSAEKTVDETSQEIKTPVQGDTVTISDEARALAAPEESGESNQSDDESPVDQTIKMLKKQIEKLEQEVQAIEDSDLPEKMKRTQVQEKQNQIMELRDQLSEALEAKMKNSGTSVGGGTRANGFGNSVADF
ncbi:hypothetical protein [uncultured Pseudodesulfovibrio sp.]|uniref:hypothetical protein n=1 Tax=uncultured Pseudodesulfovibrio sp. TaxID=2035858 RepID=UPI0029C6B936|nr:hypothetical protein [uncultured Pseudodesulfovibrio sp.]